MKNPLKFVFCSFLLVLSMLFVAMGAKYSDTQIGLSGFLRVVGGSLATIFVLNIRDW